MTEARQPDTAWKVLAVFCGASEDTGCGAVQEFGDLPRSEAEVGDDWVHTFTPIACEVTANLSQLTSKEQQQ